ncbi:MAG: hypothetical protein ACQEP1_01465 [Nanobdellota archaeon]
MMHDNMLGPNAGKVPPDQTVRGHSEKAARAYEDARGIGRSQLRRLPWEEKSYLHLLDSVMAGHEIERKVNKGDELVSRFMIEGSAAELRYKDFSRGFMPLPKPDTPFANKWKELYSQRRRWFSSGNSIEVKEFLHKHYVVEGHKRASVATYTGFDPVPVQIERLIPKNKGDRKTREYSAYLQFESQTGISHIWFHDEDGYNKLNDRIKRLFPSFSFDDFKSEIYRPFMTLYNQFEDKRLQKIPPGELLLSYIDNHWEKGLGSSKKARKGLKKEIGRLSRMYSE